MKTSLAEPLMRQSPPRRVAVENAAHVSERQRISAGKHQSTHQNLHQAMRKRQLLPYEVSAETRPLTSAAISSPPRSHDVSTTEEEKAGDIHHPRLALTPTFRSTDINSLATQRDIHDGFTTLDSPLPEDFPRPETFALGIARQGVEALLGLRPARQLQSWFTTPLYQAFTRKVFLTLETLKASNAASPTRPVKVVRIRCTRPRIRVAEAAVIIHDGASIRAVAIRLEVRHGRWQVCAFEVA
ncbi:MAG: Rv3235 family protein [Actinomycetaceae bacterium]|nr:Rv3235 family protein [Actinomycetaceae bacterium]MDY5854302.1 Rv3235 family protein [Arcanobacterium sp.]